MLSWILSTLRRILTGVSAHLHLQIHTCSNYYEWCFLESTRLHAAPLETYFLLHIATTSTCLHAYIVTYQWRWVCGYEATPQAYQSPVSRFEQEQDAIVSWRTLLVCWSECVSECMCVLLSLTSSEVMLLLWLGRETLVKIFHNSLQWRGVHTYVHTCMHIYLYKRTSHEQTSILMYVWGKNAWMNVLICVHTYIVPSEMNEWMNEL